MAHLRKPPVALGFSFDGVDDYVEVSPSPLQPLTELTIACWFNPLSTPPTYRNLVGDRSTDPSNSMLYFATTRGLRPHVYTDPSGWLWYNSATILTLNLWHHLVLTWKRPNLRLYINGVEDANSPATRDEPKVTLARDLRIGLDAIELPPDGIIDEVRIYNRALSQAEIDDLYSIRRNIMDGCVLKLGTVGLVRGGGTQWLDESPYKNHGTVYGAKRVRCCHCNPVVDYGT